MSTRPEIIVSSLDAYRLYKLLDALPAHSFAGKDELMVEMARARLLAPAEIPPDVVTMNSTVRFVVAPSRKVLELTLVYPEDAAPDKNTISIFTPVGSALLGLSPGDSIEWPDQHGGFLKIKVKEITFQPERAGKLFM
jgi:regulator of nucleoside diphosphate kinase